MATKNKLETALPFIVMGAGFIIFYQFAADRRPRGGGRVRDLAAAPGMAPPLPAAPGSTGTRLANQKWQEVQRKLNHWHRVLGFQSIVLAVDGYPGPNTRSAWNHLSRFAQWAGSGKVRIAPIGDFPSGEPDEALASLQYFADSIAELDARSMLQLARDFRLNR